MDKYYLMHKNDICGELLYDDRRGTIHSYKDNREGLSPFLGNCDLKKMLDWWKMRSVPASRNMIREIIKSSGCESAGEYLAKNLALSMTDCYWICPENLDLKYEDIKFTKLAGYNQGKIPYHNVSSYDPNASLGGQMEKYWDLEADTPVLVKESSRYFGQQSVNEVFATHLHRLQKTEIPFVEYKGIVTDTGSVLSKCPAFTSEKIELIPAYEVVCSAKIQNDWSMYDAYIELCSVNGIDKEVIREYMDYLILSDFVISNTDEHLLNFGILRDSDSMKLIGPAPIFDSGNSMFYSDERRIPYTRAGLLERKIVSFYDTEEKMLTKVENRNILKEDLLPSPEEVKELYGESNIPEWKVDFIAENYVAKIQMLREFQKGKTISLYHERQAEKQFLNHTKAVKDMGKFIMICGEHSSTKAEIVEEMCAQYQDKGCEMKDSKILYSAEQAEKAVTFIQDKTAVLEKAVPVAEYKNAAVHISTDYIYEELKSKQIQPDKDFVSLIAEMRMKTALISGATVIYEDCEPGRKTRELLIGLAENSGVSKKELHVVQWKKDMQTPSCDEGWDSVEVH